MLSVPVSRVNERPTLRSRVAEEGSTKWTRMPPDGEKLTVKFVKMSVISLPSPPASDISGVGRYHLTWRLSR